MLCKGTTWLHIAHVPEVGAADPTFTVQDASLMAQIGRLGYGGTPIVGAHLYSAPSCPIRRWSLVRGPGAPCGFAEMD